MKRILLVAGLLVMLSGSGTANLLVNGDFEQPLSVGWKDTVFSLGGDYRFERSDTFGSGTGYAAKVYKLLALFASLSQVAPVPGPDLRLSFDARLRIEEGSSTCWPVAAVFARYRTGQGRELGATCWYKHSIYANWRSSDTFHLIEVTADGWNHYELDIAAELNANLPRINPADVAQVVIDLYAYDSGT